MAAPDVLTFYSQEGISDPAFSHEPAYPFYGILGDVPEERCQASVFEDSAFHGHTTSVYGYPSPVFESPTSFYDYQLSVYKYLVPVYEHQPHEPVNSEPVHEPDNIDPPAGTWSPDTFVSGTTPSTRPESDPVGENEGSDHLKTEPSEEDETTGRSVQNPYRVHRIYQTPRATDGLYHCPGDGQTVCEHPNHHPTNLKCELDIYIDSHLKPYVCEECPDDDPKRFSSRACLLRHGREHHQESNTFVCDWPGCDRSKPGEGFRRDWNLRDHKERIHGVIDQSLKQSTTTRIKKPGKKSTKVPTKSRPSNEQVLRVEAEIRNILHGFPYPIKLGQIMKRIATDEAKSRLVTDSQVSQS